MTVDQKAYTIIFIWSVLFFVAGFIVGGHNTNQGFEREIIELRIELTQLEIKKLKGVSNE